MLSNCNKLLLLLNLLLLTGTAYAYDVPDKYHNGVTVVHSTSMAPLSFLGVNGEPKGFVVDFWRKWANDTGVPVKFKLVDWKEGLALVKSGECDIHGSLYQTPERLKYLDYAEETFPIKSILYVKKDSPIQSLAELGRHSIGVLEQGSSVELIRKRTINPNMTRYPSTGAEVAALINGEVEAIVMDSHVFQYLVGQLGAGKEVEGREVVYENNLYPAVAKGNTELRELVSWGMTLISQKERDDIIRRWYIVDSGTSHGLKIAVVVSVVGLLCALAWFIFGGRRKRSAE